MKKLYFLGLLLIVFLSACSHYSNENTSGSDNNTGASTSVPPIIKEPEQSSDKVLNLSGKSLTKVDMSVFDKTNLEELNLSNNNLSGALPAEIRKLKNLKVLNASNNDMTGVPAEIGQLSKLEVLDLSNNSLTGLPNELANLKNLKTLNLSGNDYSEQDLMIIRNSLPDVEYILE